MNKSDKAHRWDGCWKHKLLLAICQSRYSWKTGTFQGLDLPTTHSDYTRADLRIGAIVCYMRILSNNLYVVRKLSWKIEKLASLIWKVQYEVGKDEVRKFSSKLDSEDSQT